MLFVSFAFMVSACQPGEQPGSEYIEDMARGPAYKAFAPNQGTKSGITLQHPVAGTISRGYHPFHYAKNEADAMRAGIELSNPYHSNDAKVLEKGKVLYQTYCLVCHGEQGKGDGPIASKIPTPPSYKSDRLMAYPPGRFFHVITLGAGRMPAYAVQLAPDERWQIITYIRTQLQGLPEASNGTNGPAIPESEADAAPGAPPGSAPRTSIAPPAAPPAAAPPGAPEPPPAAAPPTEAPAAPAPMTAPAAVPPAATPPAAPAGSAAGSGGSR
jgi:mono/diheme cytochrome c family protein